jgi:hypothetical protein
MAPVALGSETMAAVSGAYVGAPNPIRTIPGGGLPWIISSAQGELPVDGELTMSVRELVLAQAEPVPGNLQGTNPTPTFHAIVSCQSVDDAGAPTLASVRTADVAASPTGDADISRHGLPPAAVRCPDRVRFGWKMVSAAGSLQRESNK